MTLTDDEVRAIDEAARVLRRVAGEVDAYALVIHVGREGGLVYGFDRAGVRIDGSSGVGVFGHHMPESPGEALRRLVGQ